MNLLIVMTLIFSSFIYAVEVDFYQNKARFYSHKLKLDFKKDLLYFPVGKKSLDQAAEVFAQCGIKLVFEDNSSEQSLNLNSLASLENLSQKIGAHLLGAKSFVQKRTYNLMHEDESYINGRLTKKQCQLIQKSKYVFKNLNQDKTCPNIIDPLRGMIKFERTQEDCFGVNKIISELSFVNDNISDLHPVSGIDFYLKKSSNHLLYKDQHFFEGALLASYDYYGHKPLHAKQSSSLWIHELGHAMLNEQLKMDWPWYGVRISLFRLWNEAIREDDSVASGVLYEQIQNYPKIFEFEEFIGVYHELFADLMVAIYYHDPEIMSYALAPPDDLEAINVDLEEKEHLRQRSFNEYIPLNSLDEDEVHSYFAPARKPLWDYVLALKKRGRSSKQIVRVIYTIFKDEMLELSLLKQNEINRLNLNKRLLEKLKSKSSADRSPFL